MECPAVGESPCIVKSGRLILRICPIIHWRIANCMTRTHCLPVKEASSLFVIILPPNILDWKSYLVVALEEHSKIVLQRNLSIVWETC